MSQRRATLESGTRFGSYRIVAPIGAGGMGEVWRATDPALQRDVALKVLPEGQHLDPVALRRLEREARLLAALDHPNLATVHGLEREGDVQALVMELVDGETLDHRIERSPRGLHVGDTVDIATQIATALEAAHERGVVHCDLKPANIKIRPDGRVKVLDFGIAKALSAGSGENHDRTVTQVPRVVIGTPSYMSPEQASGADVDRRTDIWAFGCILYEMLTGKRAFEGDTTSRILARVLERQPDWHLLPRDLPPNIPRLVRQCLEKDVRRRRRDAADLRLDLEYVLNEPVEERAITQNQMRRSAVWLTGAVGVAALAASVSIFLDETAEPSQQFAAEITTGITSRPNEFELSPDGRYFAYIADFSADSIARSLFLRDLQTGKTVRLAGTEWAKHPCWSPDGRSIAFFAKEFLLRVDVSRGTLERLAPAANGIGCTWGESGQILFTPNAVSGLYSVSEFPGGPVRQVTRLNLVAAPGAPDHELLHEHPRFIPGTKQFVYRVLGGSDAAGIYLGSLDEEGVTRLTAVSSVAYFVAPHWLVYSQGNLLIAHRLDLAARVLTDERWAIAESTSAGQGFAFTSDRNGERIAFRSPASLRGRLTILDRDGNKLQVLDRNFNGIAVAPDGLSIAFGSNRDIHVANLDGTGGQRIVGEATAEDFPEFSPDSSALIYERQRTDDNLFELWKVELASREAKVFYSDAENRRNLIPIDWSENGYFLARRTDEDFLSTDLIAISTVDENEPPIEVASTNYDERLGEFSPSGQYVVYDSTRPGQFGVFVQAFPDPGNRLYHVTGYGYAPRWNGDDEIIYLALDGGIMSVQVEYTDADLEFGTPVELTRERLRFGEPGFQHPYDITSDGRILINVNEVDGTPPPITLITNPTLFSDRLGD